MRSQARFTLHQIGSKFVFFSLIMEALLPDRECASKMDLIASNMGSREKGRGEGTKPPMATASPPPSVPPPPPHPSNAALNTDFTQHSLRDGLE
jgi:hypothetical protein